MVMAMMVVMMIIIRMIMIITVMMMIIRMIMMITVMIGWSCMMTDECLRAIPCLSASQSVQWREAHPIFVIF